MGEGGEHHSNGNKRKVHLLQELSPGGLEIFWIPIQLPPFCGEFGALELVALVKDAVAVSGLGVEGHEIQQVSLHTVYAVDLVEGCVGTTGGSGDRWHEI